MPDTLFLLDHLAYRVDTSKVALAPIPWPDGLAPVAADSVVVPEDGRLPACDVLLVTWTVAEAQALADVLTPMHPSNTWVKYDKGFEDDYKPHLTWKSPAADSKCMAVYWPLTIGTTKVLAVKSDLHLSTDDITLPLRALIKQMIEESNPTLVITTGTAGGIGEHIVEGDVLVTNRARFNCQKGFKGQPFAKASYQSAALPAGVPAIADLLAANAGNLRPVADREPRVWLSGDVQTTDFFAFDDSEDTYGLRAYDPESMMVEMDDATFGLACSEDITNPPAWISIRNASDPQIPSSVGNEAAQAKQAESIYQKYGYWTTVGSAVVCWSQIVAHQSKGPQTR